MNVASLPGAPGVHHNQVQLPNATANKAPSSGLLAQASDWIAIISKDPMLCGGIIALSVMAIASPFNVGVPVIVGTGLNYVLPGNFISSNLERFMPPSFVSILMQSIQGGLGIYYTYATLQGDIGGIQKIMISVPTSFLCLNELLKPAYEEIVSSSAQLANARQQRIAFQANIQSKFDEEQPDEETIKGIRESIRKHRLALISDQGMTVRNNVIFLENGEDCFSGTAFKMHPKDKAAEEWCLLKKGGSFVTQEAARYGESTMVEYIERQYVLVLASNVEKMLLKGDKHPYLRCDFAPDNFLRGTIVSNMLNPDLSDSCKSSRLK